MMHHVKICLMLGVHLNSTGKLLNTNKIIENT
jgi:hypothetical protein